MAKVRVRRGTEGPRHDPYSFTEVTFTRTDGVVVKAHAGLGHWVQLDGQRLSTPEALATFQELTGMSFDDAERIPDLLEDRYVRRLSRDDRSSYWCMKSCNDRLLSYAR